MKISSNNSLEDLAGLEMLEQVGGDLIIILEYRLNSLEGLENLKEIGGGLEITHNDQLSTCNGLTQLQTIGGDLDISFNHSLTTLSGLKNLKTIDGDLTIGRNNILTGLAELPHFDYRSIENAYITFNPLLSVCQQYTICSHFANEGQGAVFTNAPGCNSIAEILDSCAGILGVNEPAKESLPIHIFPNPTTGQVQIHGTESVKGLLRLSDPSGRTVAQKILDGDTTLDLSLQRKGLYFLHFQTARGSYSEKVVKF